MKTTQKAFMLYVYNFCSKALIFCCKIKKINLQLLEKSYTNIFYLTEIPNFCYRLMGNKYRTYKSIIFKT